jgi:Na+-transporting methylmalonyl-CoA/oxaloacetate decarboxylase gamma subunit
MADTQSARTIAYSRAPFSTWLGIVFLFLLFGLIVLAVIGPSPRTSDYEETRAKKRMEKLKALHEESQKDLTTYAWVDKNKGVARIPIDRAMEVTVADLTQKKPAPAGPISTPASAEATAGKPAAQTAPAGASPAPAASQQPGVAQPAQPSAPAGSPTGQGAASPSPATQQSPPAPTLPAPASTP